MPTEKSDSVPARYIGLDALRGCAALSVLLYHLQADGHGDTIPGQYHFFASGYLAVDLFFLLSGFVIAHAYADKLQNSLTIREFLISRFIRLQPIIAVGTLLGFIFALTQRVLDHSGAYGFYEITTSIIPNLLILPNPLFLTAFFLFNPPAWSLFYEMLAYGVYAIVIKLKSISSKSLIIMFILSVLGLMYQAFLRGNLNYGVDLEGAPIAALRIIISFTLGTFLHASQKYWLKHVPQVSLFWIMAMCMISLSLDIQGLARYIYDLVFVFLISPCLLMLAARTRMSSSFRNLAAQIGFLSFPIYALHTPIKHIVEHSVHLPHHWFVVVVCSITFSGAWITGHKIDPLMRRYLQSLLRTPTSRTNRCAKEVA